MEWLTIILITGGIYTLIWAINNKKKKDMISKGRYIERDKWFIKQRHFFFTVVSDFTAIAKAIDQNALREEKISFEPALANGQIVFHNKISFGTFGARLKVLGQREQDSLYAYQFQVEAWRENKNGITRQDLFGANALLTLIEQAFLRLDPNTQTQRAAAEYKSRLAI